MITDAAMQPEPEEDREVKPGDKGGPSKSQRQMLAVLNLRGYKMYLGTVPAKVKARRRAASKVARRSRRGNR